MTSSSLRFGYEDLGAPVTTEQLIARARDCGIELPVAPEPKGDYRSATVHGDVVYTAGMGTAVHGVRQHVGYVGADVDLEQAQEAAVIATMNALAAAIAAVGGIENIERIVRITGYVRSAPGFTGQSAVLDIASQRLAALLGSRGVHVRSAVGVAELPFGIPVEVEMIAACRRGRNVRAVTD